MRCRLCDSTRLSSVLDLGATPPCEKFLTTEELDLPEPTYPLHLRVCEDCLLLQIPALITPEETFTEYAYYSSYSTTWLAHARDYVHTTIRDLGLDRDSFVIEVASNDGYLLRHMVEASVPCLGIEPSINVGDAAREAGVPTLTAFLDETLAASIRAEHGPADLVVANNVYAHIPDLLGFTQALRTLLADNGWLSIEVHYAADLVAHGQFDTIYHEHFQYYTLHSAQRALATAGLTLVDAQTLPTHGGSLRLWARPHPVATTPSPRLTRLLTREAEAGLHTPHGYTTLQHRAETTRHQLLRYLLDAKTAGKHIAGYGAPGKGNTLLNYCGIRPDLLEYTVDRNPYKHGRHTPGTRIPIHPPHHLDTHKPDTILVLPWNLETEITHQLRHVADWGGELVFPLPTLHRADLGREPVPVGGHAPHSEREH